MEERPEKSTRRELTEATIETALQVVPLIGGPLATVFATAVGMSISRRMDAWLDNLAEEVEQLGLVVADLARDERFVDAAVLATRAAQATHDADKLHALRNAVLNSFGPDAPAAEEQARFLRFVDDFSGPHLRLLDFLDDPRAALASEGVEGPQLLAGGRSAVLEALPEWRGRRDWYDLLFGDLANARLVDGSLHATQTGPSLYESCTSTLGKRFLSYVSDRPLTG